VGAAQGPALSLPASARIAAPASELWLFTICDPWAFALPADRVERLMPVEEGRLVDVDPRSSPPASLGVLVAGGRYHSAWDLGLLLGLPPQSAAWVLLELSGQGVPLPLALRTGPCLSVGRLPAVGTHPLPPALCSTRRGLIAAAFRAPAAGRGRRDLSPVGLALALEPLLFDDEKTHALSVLLAAEAEAVGDATGAMGA
jgi:hypothetical protein